MTYRKEDKMELQIKRVSSCLQLRNKQKRQLILLGRYVTGFRHIFVIMSRLNYMLQFGSFCTWNAKGSFTTRISYRNRGLASGLLSQRRDCDITSYSLPPLALGCLPYWIEDTSWLDIWSSYIYVLQPKCPRMPMSAERGYESSFHDLIFKR